VMHQTEPPKRRRAIWRWFSRPNTRISRLETTIEDFRHEPASRELVAGGERTRDAAGQLLDEAQTFQRAGNRGAGWAILHGSQRLALLSYADDDLAALVTSLRNECQHKLRGWRRTATSEHLGCPGFKPRRTDVQQAMKILHEDSNNTYHKLELVGQQLRLLTPSLLIALLLLAGVVGYGKYDIGALEPRDLLMVMLLGALGGALSAVRSMASGSARGISESLSAAPITSLRPLIGASAAPESPCSCKQASENSVTARRSRCSRPRLPQASARSGSLA
jgi:hypothetical protein